MNYERNIPEEDFDAIEQYILKALSPEEEKSFARRLSANTQLQQQVKEVRLLFLGVQETVLEQQMQDFHTGVEAKNALHRPAGKLLRMRKWLVAASVLIVVGIGSLLVWNALNTNEKLFAQYFSPDPGLISAMSTSDNYLFDRAMVDYKTGNYSKAIQTWEALLKGTNPKEDTLHYFIASAYLATGNAAEAIDHFDQVIADSNSYFLNEANWYKGLALIKEGRTEEAIPFIQESDRDNKSELLQKIEK